MFDEAKYTRPMIQEMKGSKELCTWAEERIIVHKKKEATRGSLRVSTPEPKNHHAAA